MHHSNLNPNNSIRSPNNAGDHVLASNIFMNINHGVYLICIPSQSQAKLGPTKTLATDYKQSPSNMNECERRHSEDVKTLSLCKWRMRRHEHPLMATTSGCAIVVFSCTRITIVFLISSYLDVQNQLLDVLKGQYMLLLLSLIIAASRI